ncbi:hypothetical protein TBR22_A43490 [Luteitalea sp. TBR-22]|uniref:DoxX family protein n=1 Tax=Luteitalea sp. TBR-22 TaxID=2802971 RepID=UPI001AF70ABF|nr:DoxX family protein [Luteitalea sp. TBR-22]BCS35123.1 hypothetical protein TBR22_A43490 [Luteitalea sp. TBR-22]
MTLTLTHVLQIVVGLGLLNVWLVRRQSATAYRGGRSRTLQQEFETYGLPSAAFYVVGALKITAAIVLLAGLWMAVPVRGAALVVLGLMLGAIAMHVKVGDPLMKSVPAVLMLAMCGGIVLLP